MAKYIIYKLITKKKVNKVSVCINCAVEKLLGLYSTSAKTHFEYLELYVSKIFFEKYAVIINKIFCEIIRYKIKFSNKSICPAIKIGYPGVFHVLGRQPISLYAKDLQKIKLSAELIYSIGSVLEYILVASGIKRKIILKTTNNKVVIE